MFKQKIVWHRYSEDCKPDKDGEYYNVIDSHGNLREAMFVNDVNSRIVPDEDDEEYLLRRRRNVFIMEFDKKYGYPIYYDSYEDHTESCRDYAHGFIDIDIEGFDWRVALRFDVVCWAEIPNNKDILAHIDDLPEVQNVSD